MIRNVKTFAIILASLFILVSFGRSTASAAVADALPKISISSKIINDLFSYVPAPLIGIVTTMKQFAEGIAVFIPHVDLNVVDPRTWFGKADTWFYGVTTFHLAQIVKT